MYPLVYKFLMINHHVAIPGVGNFFLEKKTASFDFLDKVFHPPLSKINFSEGELAAEKKFYSFLATEKNVNDIQAIQLYNEFAFDLKNNILNEFSVELPGIGTLRKGDSNAISFTPFAFPDLYLKDLQATTVIGTSRKEHFVTVGNEQRTSTQQIQDYLEEDVEVQVTKDRWWIFALLLAIAGISAIIFYYYKTGNLS